MISPAPTLLTDDDDDDDDDDEVHVPISISTINIIITYAIISHTCKSHCFPFCLHIPTHTMELIIIIHVVQHHI